MRTLALLLALAAAAQAQPADAVLVVATDGMAVYVAPDGGTPRGPVAPGTPVTVPAGRVHVTALTDVQAWDGPRAEVDIDAVAGDTVRVTLAVPVRYRIESVPLGATVAVAGRSVGTTPVNVDLARGATAAATVRLAGYTDAVAPLGGAGGPIAVVLRPAGAAEGPPLVVRLPTQRSPRVRTWIDVGVGALTLAAGAVAVHYKFRADALDDRYRDPESPERGTESLREEAENLDLRSGLALGAMQVGVGVLALRFILR